MQRLVANEERREAHELLQQQPNQHQQHEASYSDFLAIHPHVFVEATDLLEADSWLRMTEAKFGLLCYSEMQKMLFATQQLRESAGAWWATVTATLPASYQVSWAKFC
jgi:phage-related tail fiber protein